MCVCGERERKLSISCTPMHPYMFASHQIHGNYIVWSYFLHVSFMCTQMPSWYLYTMVYNIVLQRFLLNKILYIFISSSTNPMVHWSTEWLRKWNTLFPNIFPFFVFKYTALVQSVSQCTIYWEKRKPF